MGAGKYVTNIALSYLLLKARCRAGLAKESFSLPIMALVFICAQTAKHNHHLVLTNNAVRPKFISHQII